MTVKELTTKKIILREQRMTGGQTLHLNQRRVGLEVRVGQHNMTNSCLL